MTQQKNNQQESIKMEIHTEKNSREEIKVKQTSEWMMRVS
jgi:hypothetical protein